MTSFSEHIFPCRRFSVESCESLQGLLTILRRINDGCKAEGSLSFTVERFDFHLKLRRRRDGGVFVDVAIGLGVGHRHLHPLVVALLFEGHNVAKVGPVVVLWLYRLKRGTSNKSC